ncbi:type II toxin-antitoxin system PemK/MazF family toxin [Arthrobacter citreus]|uniref:Type II toxin-antitoxin system PemK/MazF family toxin n=1 Tax=Arthrobacter citreus TaxID=1670 RepID=A0ABZ2ZXP9_9MICC
MSFSSRSLLSLARTALRLLSGSGAGGPGSSGSPRTTSRSAPTRRRTGSAPQSRASGPKKSSPSSPSTPGKSQASAGRSSSPGKAPASYPGDYRGKVIPRYAPSPDGSPDPGEVVWAWVPYEDDYSQGKDRPVLLIGHSGKRLLALMMTTRDRNNGRESDPDYVDVGTGSWDAQGRPSEVKVDRVLQLDPASVRRQGAVLSPAAFERVRKAFAARG